MWHILPKKKFPSIFGGHLEFLDKTQKRIILETVQDRAISTKFLTQRICAESTGTFYIFCVKQKKCNYLRNSVR